MASQRIIPVISTTTIGSGTTIAGSSGFAKTSVGASVAVGMRVVGAGFPFLSVVNVIAADAFTIMHEETKKVLYNTSGSLGSASVQVGVFASAAYAAGDALGFPFRFSMSLIRQLVLTDPTKAINGVSLGVFRAPFTEIADNAAWTPAAADLKNLLGVIPLSAKIVSTNANVFQRPEDSLPFDCGGLLQVYGQLVIDAGTPTFTSISDVVLEIQGE